MAGESGMSGDFVGALARLPDTLRHLAEQPVPSGLPSHEAIEHLLIVASGDDANDAALVAAVCTPFSPVPILVHRGYELPSFVDVGTLVVGVSVRGDSDETAEVFAQAAETGAALAAIAGPGPLQELATERSVPLVDVPLAAAHPRPLPGVAAIPLIRMLGQVGFAPGGAEWIDAAIAQLERRHGELEGDASPARTLARRIGRTIPLVYAGGATGDPIGRWWKSACNLGPKVPAFAHVVPDLCHEELAGFGQHGDVTRQIFTVVLCRHDNEHPKVVEQFSRLPDLLDEVVAQMLPVQAKGDGPLAQALDLALIGQHVGIALAADADVDPGPVPLVDELLDAVRSTEL